MKKTLSALLLVMIMLGTLTLTSCDAIVDLIADLIGQTTNIQLETPKNLIVENDILTWSIVDNAESYVVSVNNIETECDENEYSLKNLAAGAYTLMVKAVGDGTVYISSGFSEEITYNKVSAPSNPADPPKEGEVSDTFGKFNPIYTENAYLGYGIDIINAYAVNSKNILLTYPIFDMSLLMEEKLLYSNEHYNEFYTISGSSIETFVDNMSNSLSVSAGQTVSAEGNIKGVDAEGSVSLSGGLSSAFVKTSESVASQYFLEIIAENQSYWLVLQTSESRYKKMLSEEFEKDLYNPNVSPEKLFEKYGTHLVTSVAMGGNICMYYTMYSYDSTVKEENYAEIATELSTNVKAAYGSYSGDVSQDMSFEDVYTHLQTAKKYNINISEEIRVAGGEAFGINNEITLYQNYFDWQKSLDSNPVIIGVKDNNSLYPIWDLLDLNVEGATERYQELYNYFAKYGQDSYNKLCETYQLTPTVSPTGIANIKVGEYGDYSENQTVNVTAGQTLQIAFDVLPENANKYKKTFSVNDETLATVDSDTGIVTIDPKTPAGSYITVTIGAGAVNKQVKLFVVNSYTINFNTRVQGLSIDPIYGVAEGESIYEYKPEIEREGFVLEGWYKDSKNETKFNFETDYVTENLTLYANWVAIKPIVTFKYLNGGEDTKVNVKYNGVVAQPKNPSKDGYVFVGWYEDEEYTVEYDFATMLTEDITLYAKWEEILFTVTFETNGGTPLAPQETGISKSYKIEEPHTVKTNYSIEGWYTDPEFVSKFYFNSVVSQDIILYAKWEPVKVTVNFVDFDGTTEVKDSNGFVIVSQITDKDSGFKITPVTPYKEDHIFKGWYYNNEKIDLETYEFVSNGENTYTLIALWMTDSYTIKYSVENEKELGKEVTVIRGYEPEEYIPVKEGHEFSGWTYYKNGEVYDLESSSPKTGDIIEAKGYMVKLSYTITFDTGSGTHITSLTVPYGDSVVLPSNPTKDGYSFSGWNPAPPKTMPAENITLVAQWNLNTCNIIYNLNDTIHGDVEKTETKDVVSHNVTYLGYARATTYGEYYSFDGWFTAASGGVQITDENGTLIKNVSGYTNSSGKWISTEESITLYAHWSQTKDGTYIVDAKGFEKISENSSGHYRIIKDEIDISTVGIIGDFMGVLDGDGHTLSGWTCSTNATDYVGIFKVNYGTIRNLNITLATLTVDNDSEASDYLFSVGILCGANANGGVISNVNIDKSSVRVFVGHTDYDVECIAHVGVLAGVNHNRIENCIISNSSAHGETHTRGKNKTTHANTYVGGIVGTTTGNSNVVSCIVKSTTIYAKSWGCHKSNIWDGYWSAQINSASGGIVGQANSATISSCQSNGNTIEAHVANAASDCQHTYKGEICGLNDHSTIK